eukprot:TRINITY_DN2803_c0_g1_i1.p1 TRINITY_DN2803_c0_g1~~TRINITY_DN2803_c0_g1_i1.p1  ORF type:complete len:105 (-),score=20.00 TRINITY_DN2803_c0_g1_i1:13-327(-)
MAGRAIKQLIPLADRVLVKKVKIPEKTIGGILIPESAQKSPLNEAEVCAVGPGLRSKEGQIFPLSVKVGDVVALSEYGGQTIKINNEEFTLVHEGDILGIIKKD